MLCVLSHFFVLLYPRKFIMVTVNQLDWPNQRMLVQYRVLSAMLGDTIKRCIVATKMVCRTAKPKVVSSMPCPISYVGWYYKEMYRVSRYTRYVGPPNQWSWVQCRFLSAMLGGTINRYIVYRGHTYGMSKHQWWSLLFVRLLYSAYNDNICVSIPTVFLWASELERETETSN